MAECLFQLKQDTPFLLTKLTLNLPSPAPRVGDVAGTEVAVCHCRYIMQELPSRPEMEPASSLSARLTQPDMTNRRDVTSELHQSESRFRDIVEMVADWIWETDEELRLTFLSQGAAATFLEGYDSLLGKSWNELPISYVHIDDSVGYLSQMSNRHAFRDALLRVDLTRGNHRYIKLSGKPVFDETGGFRGYRGAGANATEEFLARNEVRLLKDRLHDAVESLFESFALYDADDRLVLANQRRFDQHPGIP